MKLRLSKLKFYRYSASDVPLNTYITWRTLAFKAIFMLTLVEAVRMMVVRWLASLGATYSPVSKLRTLGIR